MGYLKISVKPVSIFFFLSLSMYTVYLCWISLHVNLRIYIYKHSWICIQICIYMSGQPPLLHLCVQLYFATNMGVLKDGPRPQLNSLTSKDSPKVSAA